MYRKKGIAYNPYFLVPFLLWIIAGAVLLLCFSKEQLFFAINTHYTPFTDVVMYYTTWLGEGWCITVMLLLLFGLRSLRNLWFIITATLCSLIPLTFQQGMKAYFNAPRPRLYFHDSAAMHYLPAWPSLIHNSFPSGHSEGAFSFFCLVSLLLPVKYQKAGFIFFAIALCVCYSRIYLTAHFFEDVYAGSIVGGVITTLVYSVMYHFKRKLSSGENAFE